MPTAGIVNATLISIYAGTTKIANITSATLSMTHALREITSNDSAGWEAYAGGKRGWEMSGDSLFTFDGAYTFDDLFALIDGRTTITAKFSTEVTGDKKYSGTAYLTALSATGSTEENETYSFTLKGSGAIAEATV
jgi:predicted secreted protein